MSTARINCLNIALMVAAAAVACALPFRLFLLSYAVLGPLHYLTQLSWLHDRGYFASRRSDAWVLALLTLLAFSAGHSIAGLEAWTPELTLLAVGMALVFVLTDSNRVRALAMPAVVAVALLGHAFDPGVRTAGSGALPGSLYGILLTVYLATIVHVFVFTGAFILWGALKSDSGTGLLSLAVFLAGAVVCLTAAAPAAPDPAAVPHLGAYTEAIGAALWSLLDDLPFYEPPTVERFFDSPATVQVGRFIAYAYTYHYLNWFSKTSIIRWHEVPPRRSVGILILWSASVSLYAVDYTTGLRWLLLLSLLHVFLEFPLNWRSLFGIGQELRRRLRS